MEIRHIVLLNYGDAGRINQHVLCNGCLVFNSPWSDSSPETKVERDGDKLTIESKEIVLRIIGRKIVYLEAVYSIDSKVEFMELTPSPYPYDFFLMKRHFLSRLKGTPSCSIDKETVHLSKRRIGCFIIPVFLYLLRRTVKDFLVGLPQHIVDYIVSCPAEKGQAVTIKTTLGTYVRFFCSMQGVFLRLGVPVVFIDEVFLIPTIAYLHAFSHVCSFLVSLLIESVHLLNNSSYNPLKRRRDTMILNTDQIFMSALIFSFVLLIMFNIVHFYILCSFMRLCLAGLRFTRNFIDFVLMDFSKCRTYDLSIDYDKAPAIKLRYTKVSIYDRIKLAVQASFLSLGLFKDSILVRFLAEIK
ncbi:hypothetical protein EHEL_040350 [Encephalitozoon hellem ATCC 50504]|uniref:Uncharacterized protein n=1 Tax=Encephalitozoon hellem TaxID=27973 RepID=A0A9Q9C2J5_ENCHE|nr:uncharacterized protein EHEL_040350 [Encephalitozoon hellem ATCC 50504]AFM98087.1 hypothetical protein EHEL_040350 [Encephalitozoon hellem ATCC 50504]UTX42929.1 hypothetical protein GPU96_04g06590 [Encephalitozoon hellem]|eukprot:XP_003887068.1 hypothetical protein EHEL_040350 [Encephalitozoon hellem ATCC 50504]